MEGIMAEKEGKRLLIEVHYNYGSMLMLMDRLIPSIARERMMVCYVRYKSGTDSEMTTAVARMCKSSGAVFSRADNRNMSIPARYPVDYFARFNVDRMLVESLINALKDDDVYNHLTAYPNPAHRSVALSAQAQIIFVLLNFVPRILDTEQAKMREIADKHFPDNFVI
jgi:WASH complex subunit strumpellin